jgi:uncharacterized protein
MTNNFISDVLTNSSNRAILSAWQRIELPNAWLVAGCLFQTIWNIKSSQPPDQNIKDYDIFYFDADDLSAESEQQAQGHIASLFSDLDITIEVANQARVHLWYPEFFGHPYSPLTSAVDGIRHFLVKETCVGVRPGELNAPYGLAGMYAGTLTANPLVPHANLFARKVASYRQRWPWLSSIANDV